MSAPSPYLIHISDERIDRLRQKLAIASFPGDDIESDETWAYGPPRSEIRRLTRVWLEDYDWRKAEARLNKLEQFTTEVALSRTSTKYTVHFLHRKSSSPNAVPLLFLHGWPGSFLEASKIVDLLAENDSGSTSFDIVAPSLLDFGFSSRTPVCWNSQASLISNEGKDRRWANFSCFLSHREGSRCEIMLRSTPA